MQMRESSSVRLVVLKRIIIAVCSCFFVFLLLNFGTQWMKSPVSNQKSHALQEVECSFDTGVDQPRKWRMCTLPHNWDQYNPDYAGDAWYRFRVARPSEVSEPLAMWLVASMNASVTVNGIHLDSGGSMEEPVARHWNQHLLFSIPKALLNYDSNNVIIQVRGYANNSSGLLKLYIGPASLLKENHQVLMLRSNLLTYGALIITLLIGLLAGVAALVGRSWTVGYFALGCLISMLYVLDTVVVNIPVSRELWERGVHISIVCSEMFFVLFAFRILNFHKRWLALGIFMYGAIGTVMIMLVSEPRLIPTASIWEGLSLNMVIIADLICFWRWFKGGGYIGLFVALSLFAVLVTFGHDWIPWVLGMGVEPPFTFYLGPTGFIIMMAALLISKLIADYKQEVSLSLSLDKKVQRQDVLIQRKHEAITELWKDQFVRDERDRIVRELHDGVGGMLSNALAIVEPESNIRKCLKGAIDELRVVMGALDEDADIASLLGALRPKLETEVAEYSATLKWDVKDIPSKVPNDAHTGMQFVRIVQECVHNSLRHSSANEITLYMDQHGLLLSDNGKGFDIQHVALGRGLNNLRWRANQLRATIDISSNESGTKVHICWD